MLVTLNLQLLKVESHHKLALARGTAELAAVLKVRVSAGWPHFPEAFATSTEEFPAAPMDWPGYFFIDTHEKVLVGNGGFAGPPAENGVVEIGYEIAPEQQNRGWATEAAQALLAYAFARPEIQAVGAHTLAEPNASNRVLQKLGMQFVAELPNAELGAIWCWQINRAAYKAQNPTQ